MEENVLHHSQYRLVMTFAIVFFVVIILVTLIPVPPALWGYIFAFVFGKRYMHAAVQAGTATPARAMFLGGACGLASLVGLFVLHATILRFLPSLILLLAIGASVSFWIGNVWAYWEETTNRKKGLNRAKVAEAP